MTPQERKKLFAAKSDQNLWNEARVIKTKAILKGGISAPNVEGKLIDRTQIGEDEILFIQNSSLKY